MELVREAEAYNLLVLGVAKLQDSQGELQQKGLIDKVL